MFDLSYLRRRRPLSAYDYYYPGRRRIGEKNKVSYVDVSRAYFNAKAVRPTFVKLPAEDPRAGEGNVCGRLMMSMYGTRDAAQNWSEGNSSMLGREGFVRDRACLFVVV